MREIADIKLRRLRHPRGLRPATSRRLYANAKLHAESKKFESLGPTRLSTTREWSRGGQLSTQRGVYLIGPGSQNRDFRGFLDNEMKATLMLLVLLGLHTSAVAEQRVNVHEVLRLFKERDLIPIQHLSVRLIEALPLEERNRIALAAAESLGIEACRPHLASQTLLEYLTTPTKDDSVEKAECRRQWGINTSSAELLRHMADKRVINDPRIIPFLIQGLDHPDRSSVGQKCYYALARLTGRQPGYQYWSRRGKDDQWHAEITAWWKRWWKQNHDKHPVFDTEIEARVKEEMLRLAARIETDLKPVHPELELFRAPAELSLHWGEPMFDITYTPEFYAGFAPGEAESILRFKRAGRPLPRIVIRDRFQFQALPAERKEDQTPPPNLHVCETRVIDGTDLVVEVLATSTNAQLMRDLGCRR